MIHGDTQYVMFDGCYSLLMQYNLSLACLLASIQHAVTDGPFVSSNFFPVPVEHWHVFFFTFLFSIFLCLTLVLSLSYSFFLSFSHVFTSWLLTAFYTFCLFHLNITWIPPYPFSLSFQCGLSMRCPFLFFFICSIPSFLVLSLLPCHICICLPRHYLIIFSPSLFPLHPPLSLLFLSRPSSVSLLSWSQNYFKDAWNIFDCVTVLGSITDILVTELGVSSRIWGVCV